MCSLHIVNKKKEEKKQEVAEGDLLTKLSCMAQFDNNKTPAVYPLSSRSAAPRFRGLSVQILNSSFKPGKLKWITAPTPTKILY
jgi:hypothetical protein